MATKKKAAKKAAKPAKKRSRMGDLGNPHYNTAEDEQQQNGNGGGDDEEHEQLSTDERLDQLEGVVEEILTKLKEHGISV